MTIGERARHLLRQIQALLSAAIGRIRDLHLGDRVARWDVPGRSRRAGRASADAARRAGARARRSGAVIAKGAAVGGAAAGVHARRSGAALARGAAAGGSAAAVHARRAGSHVARRSAQVRRRRMIRTRAARALGTGADTGPAILLGLPVPLLISAFVAAALIGLLLAYALTLATQTSTWGAGAVDPGTGESHRGSATVVTDRTLGPEVQRLVAAGAWRTAADFDVPRCMASQGVTQPVLAMEEVSFGSGLQKGWLIVYGNAPLSQLRTDGGAVQAVIVRTTCGDDSASTAASTRLWSGSVMLGASPS